MSIGSHSSRAFQAWIVFVFAMSFDHAPLFTTTSSINRSIMCTLATMENNPTHISHTLTDLQGTCNSVWCVVSIGSPACQRSLYRAMGQGLTAGWWWHNACSRACFIPAWFTRCHICASEFSCLCGVIACANSTLQYETLIDKFARQHHMPPAYEKQTFYGRLEHIFVIRIPHTPALEVDGPTTIVLAALSTCKLESTPSSLNALDIHFYSSLNDTLDIVDIVCLQCLVGRVPMDGGRQWAIIDRSGNLARAVFEDS